MDSLPAKRDRLAGGALVGGNRRGRQGFSIPVALMDEAKKMVGPVGLEPTTSRL